MYKICAAFAFSVVTLSACSGGGKDTTGETAADKREAASGFNALDACATLPKAKVEAISGLKIESEKLSAVTPPTDTTPGFSTCTYNLSQGGTIGFYARQTPGSGNTPELITLTRKALIDGMGATVTDISGIGSSAFTAQPMDQLHVFFGNDKYIYFMSNGVKAEKPMLEAERALAVAVVG
jgi:hypothetical protein